MCRLPAEAPFNSLDTFSHGLTPVAVFFRYFVACSIPDVLAKQDGAAWLSEPTRAGTSGQSRNPVEKIRHRIYESELEVSLLFSESVR
ncbi:MAG: hypothetical protein Q8Q12_09200 [bacterium]|nr:hypothetical protein [bacterium]